MEETKIEAPMLKLEEWREQNVPDSIWNNMYLQAYMTSRKELVRIFIVCIVVISFLAGMHFRG